MPTKSDLRKPLWIVVVYLVFTLVLYVLGPFEWITYRPIIFWALNIAFIVALIIGWNTGFSTYITDYNFEEDFSHIITSKLKYLITVNFLYELINSFRRFSITSFNLKLLFSSIKSGLVDMGGSYSNFQSSIDEEGVRALGGVAMTLFNYMWAFFAFNIILLGIIYFKDLSRYNKIVFGLNIALIIVEYVATGTNIGVFRIILIFVVFYFLKVARDKAKNKNMMTQKNKRRILILALIAVIIVLILFNKIMQSRGGILLWESSAYNVGGIHVNRDSVLFKLVPKGLYMLFVSLSAYLTQGYYGMSLSLRLPWLPGYGMGHSMAIMNLFEDIWQTPHENTYQFRASQFGWQENVQWHTMYSWFANDVSYIGVIVIMFLIGLIFSMAYRDAVVTNNPYAKLITYYMALLAIFIPCNNQLFQSTYIMFAFILAMILWLLSRGRTGVIITIGRDKL